MLQNVWSIIVEPIFATPRSLGTLLGRLLCRFLSKQAGSICCPFHSMHSVSSWCTNVFLRDIQAFVFLESKFMRQF